MNSEGLDILDPVLFGGDAGQRLVAVEYHEGEEAADEVVLFLRESAGIVQKREKFQPFLLAESAQLDGCPVEAAFEKLAGDAAINSLARFRNWKDFQKASKWLSKKTGTSLNAPDAPYLCINDPVHQFLLMSGRTLFKGLDFKDLHRMQVDIECTVSGGFEFCTAAREGDRIVAIALSDASGWVEVLEGHRLTEKELLERFVQLVRERDPDVIEGHNIFNFDLPYIRERARRHGVKLALGRDGSTPSVRASRFSVGERTLSYDRFEVYGRHVVDTMFLAQMYDISHRSLNGFGLKEIAVHFGFASSDRTYIEGRQIAATFNSDPGKVMRYVRDDIEETRKLSDLLSISNFIQAMMLPYSYQNVCVRGNATKIDALILREYIRCRHSIPKPGAVKPFEGGYTDMFVQGVINNVHHCDVRSLYPSLMVSRKLTPASDVLGVFAGMLQKLRLFRLQARKRAQDSTDRNQAAYYDGLQSAFKILINSFYGYLGFAQGRFCDFDMAERVTAAGRELLKAMVDWLNAHGARPVEIDTDGIYFVPPDGLDSAGLAAFRNEFASSLPQGIELEFDGEYKSMYSHKMKNYALLAANGEMTIKGAALKSRGLEKFQRDFMREALRMMLEGRGAEIAGLRDRYAKAISGREWPVEMFAKTENLQDSPAAYAAKLEKDGRSRSAAYELAIRSGREYRAGDQVSFYVTGERKNVAVYDKAKLVSDWDPAKRDENVPYYLAKLEALSEKFVSSPTQGELDLS